MSDSFETLWIVACQAPLCFLGKNIGVVCHFLLQGIFPTQELDLYLLHYRQTFFFFLPLSNQGSPFSFYSVLVIFHSFHFIRIAMGMSVPLILITGWTLLHVQEFYVSLLTRINTQVAREVSEVEKVLTRSISDGLTATIPFFMLPRLWCTTTCV